VPVLATEAPQTAGDVGVALMLNGLYGPAVARTVRKSGEMPFIMGQLMVFRRETLEALRDLKSVSGELVDDMRMGWTWWLPGIAMSSRPTPFPSWSAGWDSPSSLACSVGG